MIRKRVERTGDGSHRYAKQTGHVDAFNNNQGENDRVDTLWGWGELKYSLNTETRRYESSIFLDDNDMDTEERNGVKILHPKLN